MNRSRRPRSICTPTSRSKNKRSPRPSPSTARPAATGHRTRSWRISKVSDDHLPYRPPQPLPAGFRVPRGPGPHWDKPSAGHAAVRTVATRVAPDPVRVREFADALERATAPVVIYGAAVARSSAWDEATALVETLGAPVWTAPACERTPFPEDHPLYRGALPWALGPLSERLEGHDVALASARPCSATTPMSPGRTCPRVRACCTSPTIRPRRPAHRSGQPRGRCRLVARGARGTSGGTRPGAACSPHAAAVAQRRLGRAANGGAGVRGAERSPSGPRRPGRREPLHHAALQAAWPVTERDTYYTFASGGLGWNLPAAVASRSPSANPAATARWSRSSATDRSSTPSSRSGARRGCCCRS